MRKIQAAEGAVEGRARRPLSRQSEIPAVGNQSVEGRKMNSVSKWVELSTKPIKVGRSSILENRTALVL
jgi:hypothetical protein